MRLFGILYIDKYCFKSISIMIDDFGNLLCNTFFLIILHFLIVRFFKKNNINLNLAFYPLTAVNRGTRWWNMKFNVNNSLKTCCLYFVRIIDNKKLHLMHFSLMLWISSIIRAPLYNKFTGPTCLTCRTVLRTTV